MSRFVTDIFEVKPDLYVRLRLMLWFEKFWWLWIILGFIAAAGISFDWRIALAALLSACVIVPMALCFAWIVIVSDVGGVSYPCPRQVAIESDADRLRCIEVTLHSPIDRTETIAADRILATKSIGKYTAIHFRSLPRATDSPISQRIKGLPLRATQWLLIPAASLPTDFMPFAQVGI